MVQVLAGMPADVRIIESSVGEKTRLLDAFAEANLASTKLGSDSVRPSNILRDMRSCEGAMVERQNLRVTQGQSRIVGKGPCVAAHASFRDVTHQFHLITISDTNRQNEDLNTECIVEVVSERAAYAESISRTCEKRAAVPRGHAYLRSCDVQELGMQKRKEINLATQYRRYKLWIYRMLTKEDEKESQMHQGNVVFKEAETSARRDSRTRTPARKCLRMVRTIQRTFCVCLRRS